MQAKTVNGFQTGDQVRAIVTKGKKTGQHVGRVAVRASGSFNIQTAQGVVQGISWKDCRLLQRANGYRYSGFLSSTENLKNSNKREEQRFLPALKGWVSALSIG